MDRRLVLLVICFCFCFFVLTFFSQAYGVENPTLLYSNYTLKHYQRKTVLTLGDLEFKHLWVRIPVIDLTKKSLAKLVTLSLRALTKNLVYKYPIKDADKLSRLFYRYVCTQRFDKVILSQKKSFILTKTKVIEVRKGLVLPPIPQGLSFFTYENRVKTILNQRVAPILRKLLEKSLEVRYRELPERERMTFFTQTAKELGITIQLAKKLMNTGFAFAAYVSGIDGRLTLKFSKGVRKAISPYQAELCLRLSITLIIYKFDPQTKRFVFYKEIRASSGTTCVVKSLYYVVYSKNFYYPLFKKALMKAIKAAAINAYYQLKKDDNFAIYAPAEEVSGNEIQASIGLAEAIRIDAPFDIYEFVNGKRVYKGFGKVRFVANDCSLNSIKKSRIRLIKGSVEAYDLLREHPWTGVFVGLAVGVEPFSVKSIGSYEASGGGKWLTFKLTTKGDLGFIRNSKNLADVWLNFFVGYGVGGNKVTIYNFKGSNVIIDPNYYGEAGLGISKRWYLSHYGLAFSLGGDIAGRYLKFKTTTDELTIWALSLIPKFKLVYSYSPDLEFWGEVGYAYNVYSRTIYDDEWGNEYRWDADTQGGINFFFGISWQFGFVGSFSGIYAPPPSCNNYKSLIFRGGKK
ncbi:MAG: hypothetical protein GXO57_04110 [Thermodesulfobacteria bacterium]|nr:hypothetical protein [Thermodesulfobacteriota bacterium]